MYRQRVVVHIPPNFPGNRAFWLVLAIWKKGDGYENLTIHSSELRQLSDTQIVLQEFVIPAEAALPLPEDALDIRFEGGFALRGAELPAEATPGDRLRIPMTWEAEAEGEEDWVQFLHFVHEETGTLWNHDQPPLGARLPTRLWYEGLRDTEAWQIALPEDLAPGRYAIYTGLYRLSDLARLPVEDEDGVALPDARAPLGSLMIRG